MVEGYDIKNKAIAPSESKDAKVLIFTDPTPAEKERLLGEFALDPHDVNCALDPDELGRLEHEDDHTVLILKQPRNYTSADQLLFTVTSIGLFLFKDRLLVVRSEAATDLLADKTLSKAGDVRGVTLKILYSTIRHFLGHLKVINMLSDSLERRINSSMGNRYLIDMFSLEKSLVYFLNGIGSNQMVVDKLKLCAAKLRFNEDQVEILDDISIENMQCNKQAEIYSNILTGLMDARGSIVNNNLNLLIKRLTIVNVVFMPLNVLAGMGGMSEFSSFTTGTPWWIAYGLFALGLALIGALVYAVVRKMSQDKSDEAPRRGRGPRIPRKGRK